MNKFIAYVVVAIFSSLTPMMAIAGSPDNTAVKLVVSIITPDGEIESWNATTLSGHEMAIVSEEHKSYASRLSVDKDFTPIIIMDDAVSGFSFSSTPALREDGKIDINFTVKKKELISLEDFKTGEYVIQAPNIKNLELEQSLIIDQDQDVSVPFDKYTLIIKATVEVL